MNITLFSRRNGLYQETNSTDIAGNRSDYFDAKNLTNKNYWTLCLKTFCLRSQKA